MVSMSTQSQPFFGKQLIGQIILFMQGIYVFFLNCVIGTHPHETDWHNCILALTE